MVFVECTGRRERRVHRLQLDALGLVTKVTSRNDVCNREGMNYTSINYYSIRVITEETLSGFN